MSSAWGSAFGSAWASAWGAISEVEIPQSGGDDVPRKVKTEKYKPRLKKDDFGNEIPEKVEVIQKSSKYTLQDTQLLLNRLELQAEQDDEESLMMLLL